MKIAIIDFEDSFTYNIFHLIEELGFEAEVLHYEHVTPKNINFFDKVILSPGAETPNEKSVFFDVLNDIVITKPTLGICLGFQILAIFFGNKLKKLANPMHGIASKIKIMQEDELFKNIENEFLVGRYHSWGVELTNNSLIELAISENDHQIMIYKHHFFPIYGFQFHPESILTPQGKNLLRNWLLL